MKGEACSSPFSVIQNCSDCDQQIIRHCIQDPVYPAGKAYLLHESISLCEQTGNRWGMGTAYRYLGLAMMADGQIEALHTANRIHSIPLTLMALAGLAQLESHSHPKLAADWLKLIISHPAAMQETRDRACRILSKMKKSSGAGPVRGLRESLSDQSLEDLVGSILKITSHASVFRL